MGRLAISSPNSRRAHTQQDRGRSAYRPPVEAVWGQQRASLRIRDTTIRQVSRPNIIRSPLRPSGSLTRRPPEGSGVELPERLGTLDPDLPVMFMSGFAPAIVDKAAARAWRTCQFPQKPFTVGA